MKWGWKRARRLAVLPVTGPLSSLWRLPLLDSQRHCWTSSLTHSLAYRLLFWSPGPLLLSQMGKSFTMSCSADTPMTATLVTPRCSSTGTSQALIRMKLSNHTPCTNIRYRTVSIVVCSCFRSRITANTGFLVFIHMANKQELNFMTINDICSYTTLKQSSTLALGSNVTDVCRLHTFKLCSERFHWTQFVWCDMERCPVFIMKYLNMHRHSIQLIYHLHMHTNTKTK